MPDYTHWWRLPPPLPPKRWPRVLLLALAAVIGLAVAFGV